MDNDLSVVVTKDGSHSLSSVRYNATYHSIHGAIEESMHIFISAGIYRFIRQGKKELRIFEMGFGTGLNASLSNLMAIQHGLNIRYDAIELHPLKLAEIEPLNYYQEIPGLSQKLFLALHQQSWGHPNQINEHFQLHKIEDSILTYDFEAKYDLIFFDAFAPSSQPILWEQELHLKLYHALNKNGCLVTYCAQGKFKRMLKEIGYTLESLNGPGRKHEMTRAVKLK